MKKLFKNYNYDFNKNEKKILTTFCKQTLKQIENDKRYFSEERSFKSILQKLNEDTDSTKLTKEESIKLKNQLSNNLEYLKKTLAKSWFLKKMLYRSMVKQYADIIENHFGK